jgi:hypothetical protein
MKLTSIGLTVVGLMLSGTCVMAANSITTAPTNGIGRATQTIPTNPGLTQTIPTNPGLTPATPEESTGRALGTIPPQSSILPDTSGNLPDTSGGFSVSLNPSGPSLPPPRGGG